MNWSFHHICAMFSLWCEIEKPYAVAILTSLDICSLHHCSFTYSFNSARLTLRSLFSLARKTRTCRDTFLTSERGRKRHRTTVVSMLLKKIIAGKYLKNGGLCNLSSAVLKHACKLSLDWQLSRTLSDSLDRFRPRPAYDAVKLAVWYA